MGVAEALLRPELESGKAGVVNYDGEVRSQSVSSVRLTSLGLPTGVPLQQRDDSVVSAEARPHSNAPETPWSAVTTGGLTIPARRRPRSGVVFGSRRTSAESVDDEASPAEGT